MEVLHRWATFFVTRLHRFTQFEEILRMAEVANES